MIARKTMTRKITIELPDEVAHRLEVCAAKDDQRLVEGIQNLLIHLVENFKQGGSTHATI